MTSQFGFTNKTTSTKTIGVTELGVTSNYAKIVDEPTVVVLNNKTCPLDQGELITYRVSDVAKVSSSQVVQNPSRVRNGVQYVAKVENILRTTDSAGNIVSDEPVVAYLTVRHQKSGNINGTHINQIVSRLLGSIMRKDGTVRFDDMMRGAIVPDVD